MSRIRLLMILLAGVLAVAAPLVVTSQDEAPPATEETGSTVTQVQDLAPTTSLWGLVKQGGIIMFPLGLLSVAMIALVIYGFMITRPDKMLQPELVPALHEDLRKLDFDNARATCRSNTCLLTNTLHAGLERVTPSSLDVASMEKAMEEAGIQETSDGLKPINYLSIVAQVAPMLGLLGTVSGMIKAFQKIGLGMMGEPEKLAADIGEAMVTTATGLIVGIPAMFFYFYLKSKYTSNTSQLARMLGNLSHTIVEVARGDHPPAQIDAGQTEPSSAG